MSTNPSTSLRRLALLSAMACAVVSLGATAPAAADPALPSAGSGRADDVINELRVAGYEVSVNWPQGHPNVPLNECQVSEIRNPNSSADVVPQSVAVDVLCPNAK